MKIRPYSFKRVAKFVLGGGTRIFNNKREIDYDKILDDEETEWYVDWLNTPFEKAVLPQNEENLNKEDGN